MIQDNTLQELREEIEEHQQEAIELLERNMFHTAIYETKRCIELTKEIAFLLKEI